MESRFHESVDNSNQKSFWFAAISQTLQLYPRFLEWIFVLLWRSEKSRFLCIRECYDMRNTAGSLAVSVELMKIENKSLYYELKFLWRSLLRWQNLWGITAQGCKYFVSSLWQAGEKSFVNDRWFTSSYTRWVGTTLLVISTGRKQVLLTISGLFFTWFGFLSLFFSGDYIFWCNFILQLVQFFNPLVPHSLT